jgi:hypothetical protein
VDYYCRAALFELVADDVPPADDVVFNCRALARKRLSDTAKGEYRVFGL